MKDSTKKRFLSLWLILVMLMSLTAGMSLSVLAAEEEIIVLYTNDVHCRVDDNIGYAGLSLYKKQMQQQTPYVALVDAGDAIQGAPIGTLSEGGYIIDIMNQVGYEFAIPGNHEFDYGMARFLELADILDCGFYSCNFIDLKTGNPVFAPYKMFTYGDTKVAFMGVSTPESFTKSTPAYFQNEKGEYIYSFCEDESGRKLYTQIQRSVDAARAEGADYVIAVGHLGADGTMLHWTSTQVIGNTTGIDVLIDGHSHETVPSQTVKNKDGVDVIVTQTGSKLAKIGKLTIGTDGTITTELVSEVTAVSSGRSYTVKTGDTLSRIAKRELGSYNRWQEIYEANKDKIKNPDELQVGMVLVIPGTEAVTDGKAADYQTVQYIKGIQSQFNETLKTILGRTEVELTVNDPSTGDRAVRSAETNLGDLCADAYRLVLGADIGFTNGGGVRAGIAPGDITFNDILTVLPFGNMGCVAEVSGQQLKDALEMASRNCPQENGGFLQVSGLTYTIDTSVKSGVQTDEKGNFLRVDGAYRVIDIKVGNEPLDPNKTYIVASHNYMLKSAGDGMTMFAGSNIIRDEVMVDADILSTYIRSNLNGTVGAEYQNPAGQGRITIK